MGGALFLAANHGPVPPYGVFHGEPAYLRTLPGIARSALALNPRAVIQLGLLLLIATPIARVLFCAAAFWKQGDKAYVAFTLIVLMILLYSLLVG